MAVTRPMTVEEFEALDAAGSFELVWGELREVPPVGRRHGAVGSRFHVRIGAFVLEHDLGETYISDTAFVFVAGEPPLIVKPDFSFVRRERLVGLENPDAVLPFPPDLAVEVRSPTDERASVEEKLALYRVAGVPLLWYCEPRPRTVTVYRPGREPLVVGEADELDGEDVLPGFRLRVADVFAV